MTILHERCYYCNKVSSRDIETNAEEFLKKRFFRDNELPTRTSCEDCKEIIEDVLLDYEKLDDVYGWNIANENTDLAGLVVFDHTHLSVVDPETEVQDFEVD